MYLFRFDYSQFCNFIIQFKLLKLYIYNFTFPVGRYLLEKSLFGIFFREIYYILLSQNLKYRMIINSYRLFCKMAHAELCYIGT